MSGPPKLAEWLIRAAAPSGDSAFVVGDMREEFDARLASHGPRAARRWYWLETMRSCLPLAARRWRTTTRARSAASPETRMWTPLVSDARYALRLSRRSPLASLAIVATMTLGIGSTTAVFSAMKAVLLQPLPFRESNRVIQLNGTLRGGRVIDNLAYPDLMDFRRLVPDFQDVTVFDQNDLTLQHGADPLLVHAVDIDDAYARVFGLRAAFGRLFVPADLGVHAAKVVVLSYDFWMREFGGSTSVVGSNITLDDESMQVIGILPRAAYTYPRPQADLLMPLVVTPNTPMTNRGSMWAEAAARLAPGASLDQARRDLTSAAKMLAVEYPDANDGIGAWARPLRDAVVGSVTSMLQLLAAAVAAVLLIACINIANLILGRAQTRTREFAVRSALGGSPSRVRQQVLTESLMLATIGGVLGVALAPLLTHGLVAAYPDALPRADEINFDARVLIVAALATLVAGILSAIPTARRAVRLDLVQDLRDGGRSGTGRADRRVGRVLIVAQVSASLALLFGAGLLLQTFWRLTRVDPGFDARNTTTFHVFAASARYPTTTTIDHYFDEATNALREIPGVREVSTTTLLPFGGGRRYDIFIQEERGDQSPHNPATAVATVAPGVERALGLPLIRGRTFTAADDSASTHVVMINQRIAQRDYPGVNPIGRFIMWNGQPHWQIIGVVGTTHLDNLWDEPMPVLYTAAAQVPRRSRYFIVRSSLPSDQVLRAARAVLRTIDPTIALTDPATMERRIQSSLGAQRFRAVLMATLGVLALALAVIGIYGVVAYSVSRRTREIGIRMALGEAAREVRQRVVTDALRVASVGIVAGIALSLAAGKWLSGFLIGVSPYDLRLLALASALLAAVVAAAAYGPARRASHVDPVNALRGD